MSYSLLNYKTLPEEIYLAFGQIDYLQEYEDALSKEELAEFEQIKNNERKNEFLSTRHLAKGLAGKFGYKKSNFQIKKSEMGKPYAIADDQRLFLSIAHSAKNMICGLSESKDLGVDLEPVDREVNEDLRNRIFHQGERRSFKELDLIQVWTIKEALVKLEGGGLRTNLNDLLVDKLDNTEFLGRFNDDKTARICSFEYNQHWISVAYY